MTAEAGHPGRRVDRFQKIEHLRAMIAADRGDALAHFLLGCELTRAGRFLEAAETLQQAIALDPDHTASFRWLGDAWRGAGETARARDAYRQAIVVAERTGDLQVAREARAMLKRLGDAEQTADEAPA